MSSGYRPIRFTPRIKTWIQRSSTRKRHLSRSSSSYKRWGPHFPQTPTQAGDISTSSSWGPGWGSLISKELGIAINSNCSESVIRCTYCCTYWYSCETGSLGAMVRLLQLLFILFVSPVQYYQGLSWILDQLTTFGPSWKLWLIYINVLKEMGFFAVYQSKSWGPTPTLPNAHLCAVS